MVTNIALSVYLGMNSDLIDTLNSMALINLANIFIAFRILAIIFKRKDIIIRYQGKSAYYKHIFFTFWGVYKQNTVYFDLIFILQLNEGTQKLMAIVSFITLLTIRSFTTLSYLYTFFGYYKYTPKMGLLYTYGLFKPVSNTY